MRLIPTIRLTLGAWLVALSLPVAATAIISVGALAQGPCAAESETNDQPDMAVAFGGAGCVTGTLPDGDAQDVAPSIAAFRGTLSRFWFRCSST